MQYGDALQPDLLLPAEVLRWWSEASLALVADDYMGGRTREPGPLPALFAGTGLVGWLGSA